MRVTGLGGSILALSLCGAAAHGQTMYPAPYGVQPGGQSTSQLNVQPLTDADMLASELRLLAADPQNVPALVRAGELALKLDDDTAAAAFFARAGRIDPRNPRIKAGEGSLLVAAERPGEALRHFAEAEALGGDPRSFAADRGLAYDLVGEQERAQRDYRLALKAGANDETQRRYALSLGISGKRDLALAQIDPLLRRSDRGAWRTRAFILAMGGDKAGAERIAVSMMPSGMAQGLQPFFELLPVLTPANRAFAVHFGEVRASAERMADARLVPALAALGPDPTAPVVIVAAARPLVVTDAREERRKAKAARKARGRDQLAARTTPPQPQPLPPPPEYAGQAVAALVPMRAPTPAPVPVPVPARVVLAANTVRVPPVAAAVPTPRDPLSSAPATQRVTPARATQPLVVPKPMVATAVPTATPPPAAAPPPAVVPIVAAPLAAATLATSAPSSPSGPAATAQPVAQQQVPAVVTLPPPAPTPVRSEESILAAIIADIKVPGTELAVERVGDAAALADQAALEREALRQHAIADQIMADRKIADKKVATDKKAVADKKAAADKKLADKKLADAKLAEAKKLAEEKKKKDPKILEPSRVWVQVSGGANENDLPKQWAKVRTKSKAFGSRAGWTTPLRATNRILTGPFKTDAEAQSFVNTIAKDGISGFVFVSDAGQKITKLAGK